MITIPCPECQQLVTLESDLTVGQQIACQSCHTVLVVTWLFPVCLDTMEAKDQAIAARDADNDGKEQSD